MSIAESYSAQLVGLQAEVITIEVDISNGLHSFSVIGLGDRSIEESKDRVSAAIKNSGYVSPKQKNQKVVVSLAPADMHKEGPAFDLGIAITYLAATKDFAFNPGGKLFLGELSLDGNIRKISGVLPILCQAQALGFVEAFVPKDNREEASLAQGIYIYAVSSLQEVIEHLSGIKILENISPLREIETHVHPNFIDMSTVRGNEKAKRGLEIAAAGAHNVLMYGAPGTGKTLLAHSFSSILPPLSYEHSIEVTSIHSAAKTLEEGLITCPPFRSPHHTASTVSIIGGGIIPKPGEITLAHRGVLFLDEFPEFDRSVIEALRQPLEEHKITVSRIRTSVTFPAQTILLASMNPCPCGRKKGKGCICSDKIIANYWRRLSGPIIDRIDIWLQVDEIDYEKMVEQPVQQSQSEKMSINIREARQIQRSRFQNYFKLYDTQNRTSGAQINPKHIQVNTQNRLSKEKSKNIPSFNSEMTADHIEKIIKISNDARTILSTSARKLELSGRAIHRIIKVAQTIADLDMVKSGNLSLINDTIDNTELNIEIKKEHILEALSYRKKY